MYILGQTRSVVMVCVLFFVMMGSGGALFLPIIMIS